MVYTAFVKPVNGLRRVIMVGNDMICIFHRWEKFMGPQNVGDGRFAQKYKCAKCGKIREKRA